MKKVIITATTLLLLGAIVFVLSKNKEEIDQNKIVKKAFANGVAVTTDKVIRKEMDNQLNLVGSTIPLKEAQIQAQSNGEITELNIKLGDKINKGTLIAKIDDKIKQLAYENAKISVTKLETDMNKIKNMFDRNAATETQYREIKYAYENAKIQMEQSKKQLDYCKIIAPFSGIITTKSVEIGSYVNVVPATPVCYLVDMSALKISLNVSENDVYQLKEGKKVKVTCSVYPSAEYTGIITYISPKSDRGHNYPIEISMENKKDFPLKSGTFVKVQIDFENKRQPLLISRQSLIGSINDAKVFVVENGIAYAKKIVIGAEYDKYLEIIEGLKEGEEIITSGQLNLEDKMQVRVINN